MKRRIPFLSPGGLPLPLALSIMLLIRSHQAAALPMLAAIQQQTTSFIVNGAFGGFFTEFPFDYFDASLGTLESVDVDVTGSNGQPKSFYFAKLSVNHFWGPGNPQFPPCSGDVIQGRIRGCMCKVCLARWARRSSLMCNATISAEPASAQILGRAFSASAQVIPPLRISFMPVRSMSTWAHFSVRRHFYCQLVWIMHLTYGRAT
jgi:hypothetical protein